MMFYVHFDSDAKTSKVLAVRPWAASTKCPKNSPAACLYINLQRYTFCGTRRLQHKWLRAPAKRPCLKHNCLIARSALHIASACTAARRPGDQNMTVHEKAGY